MTGKTPSGSVSGPVSGDLISRYFERVLGARTVGSAVADLMKEIPSTRAAKSPGVCLLIEVGNDSDTPSIQEMGSRLVDAIRAEWVKQTRGGSPDRLPKIEWLRADENSWIDAIQDHGQDLSAAIVCGAHQSSTPDSRVVHVPSFNEMQSSHVQKREAWRAMQQLISSAINHVS